MREIAKELSHEKYHDASTVQSRLVLLYLLIDN